MRSFACDAGEDPLQKKAVNKKRVYQMRSVEDDAGEAALQIGCKQSKRLFRGD